MIRNCIWFSIQLLFLIIALYCIKTPSSPKYYESGVILEKTTLKIAKSSGLKGDGYAVTESLQRNFVVKFDKHGIETLNMDINSYFNNKVGDRITIDRTDDYSKLTLGQFLLSLFGLIGLAWNFCYFIAFLRFICIGVFGDWDTNNLLYIDIYD